MFRVLFFFFHLMVQIKVSSDLSTLNPSLIHDKVPTTEIVALVPSRLYPGKVFTIWVTLIVPEFAPQQICWHLVLYFTGALIQLLIPNLMVYCYSYFTLKEVILALTRVPGGTLIFSSCSYVTEAVLSDDCSAPAVDDLFLP